MSEFKKPPNMSDEDFGRFLADCALGPLSEPMEFDTGNVVILLTGAAVIVGIIVAHLLGYIA